MSPSSAAVVTGSRGFVGRNLVPRLGRDAVALSLGAADWERRLDDCDFSGATIFHLAARAHGEGRGTESDYERDNAAKTEALARRAAAAGARRLVFLSTVKVLGEETAPGRPFDGRSEPNPQDPYGRSKWRAEQALARVASESALEVSIVRAPLVYGRGASGNLAALVALADSPWPLPLDGIDNRRSFVHVEDLCDLLVACGSGSAAIGGTWLAAHADSPSTTRIVETLRAALGRPRRLFAVPRALLEAGGARLRRLTRSLEVDASATRAALGWEARRGIDVALADLASARRANPP